jgi:hypothetical protein
VATKEVSECKNTNLIDKKRFNPESITKVKNILPKQLIIKGNKV